MTKKIFFLCLVFGLLIWPSISLAADHCIGGTQCNGLPQTTCGSTAGCTWAVDPGATTPGSISLPNPLGIDSPNALIGKIINSVLGVVGSLALLMFVFGGLVWMTSGGSPEKVKKGREIIVWSAIGLAIIFFAYALISFLITTLKQ